MARGKRSLRKIQGLILLMLLTMILMITATYAWFSTQRDVEISGMRINVEVAENLQISLDGEKWAQSIQVANMRQLYGSYTGTGDSFTIYQANPITSTDGNTNYVPTELLPVSSAGEVSGGKLQFVQGTLATSATGKTKLEGITACSEDDLTLTETIANRQLNNEDHPYLVFDMYLRNISAKQAGVDELKLNEGSAVWVNVGPADDDEQEGDGVGGTGLEYSARVGMIVYGNTMSVTAGGDDLGKQIRGLTPTGTEVAAIWEPNDKEHTSYVVSNNGRGIDSTTQAVTTYGIKVATADATPNEIANINSTTDTNLVAVNTFKPAYTTVSAGTDDAEVITNTEGNNVGLAPNQISKVRVYVWLEGQDPDCVDLASTGDKLNINLKLTKDETNSTGDVTYAENYGPYFGRVYSTTVDSDEMAVIFYEDGSMVAYMNGSVYGTYGAGECIYGEDTIESTDYTFEMSEDKTQLSVVYNSVPLTLTIHEENAEVRTASTLTQDDYGAYVTNYTATTASNEELEIGGWRIFYSDGTNIYLIADDYVNTSYIPAGKGNTTITKGNTSYMFSMTDVINDYAGSADITESHPAKKWLSKYTYESTKNNMKATAYLMDTTVWSGFANSSYAEYAIGTPTVELFAASYNTTHTTMIETQVSSEAGYELAWSSNVESWGPELGGTIENTPDSLYTINDSTKCQGMWIASPSNDWDEELLRVQVGAVNYYQYNVPYNGARPIVALKSSVQLEKQANGLYKIVN